MSDCVCLLIVYVCVFVSSLDFVFVEYLIVLLILTVFVVIIGLVLSIGLCR